MQDDLDFGDYMMIPKHSEYECHSYLLASLTMIIFISGKKILLLSFLAEKYSPPLDNPLTNFHFFSPLHKIKLLDN